MITECIMVLAWMIVWYWIGYYIFAPIIRSVKKRRAEKKNQH